MPGYLKTEHPFSRIRSTCFFDDTNFEAFEVPPDSGTRGTGVPQLEPRTSWFGFRSTINRKSQLVRTPAMRSHQGPQSIWSSWQGLTRLALNTSDTTTSTRKFEELPVSILPVKRT